MKQLKLDPGGLEARRVLTTKNDPQAAKTASSSTTRAESQPSFGASLRPIWIPLTSPAASATSAARSIARPWAKVASSRPAAVAAAPSAAKMPGRMFTPNSQCHEKVCVSQPPASGPTVGASTAATPATIVAMSCARGGNSRNTAENTVGINVPPAKPWTIRQAISPEKPWLSAQPAEAKVNSETALTNSQRMPSCTTRNPVSGMATISAVEIGEVWIQLIWSGRIASACWMVRQRGGDDLDVEDRHEHAEAHDEESRAQTRGPACAVSASAASASLMSGLDRRLPLRLDP